jgi:hypothetical protein
MRVLKQGGVLLCFCSIGEGTVGNNHYSQEIEDMLPLKGGSKEMFITALENAGFTEVQGIMLEGIKDKHGDKDWYVIKGKNCKGSQFLKDNFFLQVSSVILYKNETSV